MAESAATILRLQQGFLAIAPLGPLIVDVEVFEGAVATARRTQEPTAYHTAIDLYTGGPSGCSPPGC